MEQRVQKLEERMDRMEERQHTLETEQAETKVYIKQIFEKIDGLKNDLVTFFKSSNQSNEKSQTQWIEFAKWIIAGTIFVIVAYIFSN